MKTEDANGSMEPGDRPFHDKSGLPNPKQPLPICLWNLIIIFGVFLNSSYTILVHLCEINRKIPFSSGALNFCIEFTKLSMSVTMFCCSEVTSRPVASSLGSTNWFPRLNLRIVLSFSVPAVLYCINNNLAVYIQLEMDPTTYQVLANLKILTTALLFRLIIKKPIHRLQWIALAILLLAGISNSVGGMVAKRNETGPTNAGTLHITFLGLLMITLYCTISGLAGVYTEYVLKKQMEINLHFQNALLYTFGLLLNSFTYFAQSGADSAMISHPFRGFSVFTWGLVFTQAAFGIIMGAVMKYANNITRLFIMSAAVVATTLASVIIFGLKLNIWFACSILLVFIALVLYHTQPPSQDTVASVPHNSLSDSKCNNA